MIPTGPATQVYLALGTTDLRKGFEGLGDLVRHQMKEDPMRGHLSVCLSLPIEIEPASSCSIGTDREPGR